MSDFAPTIRLGTFHRRTRWPVAISAMSKPRVEQRRQTGTLPYVTFNFSTPPLSTSDRATIQAFYEAKYGATTAFTFTAPDDSTEYTVRFSEEELDVGTDELFYEIPIRLVVVT